MNRLGYSVGGVFALSAAVLLFWLSGSKGISEQDPVALRHPSSSALSVRHNSPLIPVSTDEDPKLVVDGIVTDEPGDSVFGARVCLWAAGIFTNLPSNPISCVDTDRKGAFQFRASPSSSGFAVSVRSDPLCDSRVQVLTTPARGIRVTMSSGCSLASGRVKDANGGVIEGARVGLFRLTPEGGMAATPDTLGLTDDRGTFSLNVRSGEYLVRAVADGYGVTEATTSIPGSSIEIPLSAGGEITGKVINEQQAPLSNVLVSAERLGGVPGSASAMSDERGEFLIANVSIGRYAVSVKSDTWSADTQVIPLDSGTRSSPLLINAHPASSVDGEVLVAGGHCESGRVTLAGTTLLSGDVDPAGRVKIMGIPKGLYRVNVECANATSLHDTLRVETAGLHTKRWVLDRGIQVSGRVRGCDSVKVRGLQVRMVPEYTPNAATADLCLTPSPSESCSAEPLAQVTCPLSLSGDFSCTGLVKGRYTCVVAADGQPIVQVPVDVSSDSVVADLVVHECALLGGAAVAREVPTLGRNAVVQVVDARGEPMAGIWVTAGAIAGLTDESGQFAYEQPALPFLVSAYTPEGDVSTQVEAAAILTQLRVIQPSDSAQAFSLPQ